MNFLETLDVPSAVREKLNQFGARTPAALIDHINSAPDAFRKFLGTEVADQVLTELHRLAGLKEFSTKPAETFSLGAHLSSPAPLAWTSKLDVGKRDSLFARLQYLKAHPEDPDATETEIQTLESQLEELYLS